MVGTKTTGSNYFRGIFDGDGHTLTFNCTAANDYAAPFRFVANATIKNLHVDGIIETSAGYAAGIAGETYARTHIENCRSSVVIRSSRTVWGGHGGIVGLKPDWTNAILTIEGCVFDGKLLSTGATPTPNCGGLVGYTSVGSTTIVNSLYAPAALEEGETEVGGNATFICGSNFTVTNCYYTRALGTVQGKQARSIVAGANADFTLAFAGDDETEYNVSEIITCGTGLQYGDLLYAGNGDNVSLDLTAPAGYVIASATYTPEGGTATAITPDENGVYTFAMPDADVTINAIVTIMDWEGNGTEDDPYLIYYPVQLDLLATRVNNGNDYSSTYFMVMNDMEYDANVEDNFTPIGDMSSHKFNGHFDGQGYTISGINTGLFNNYNGLFGYLDSGAEVKDIVLDNSSINYGTRTGGIAGANEGTVTNCHVTTTVTFNGNAFFVGGIVGENKGSVSQCTSAGTFTSSGITGGIAAYNYNTGTLSDNFVVGATILTAGDGDGTVVGYNQGTLQRNYYNNCTVADVENATEVGCGNADITDNDGAVPGNKIILAEHVTSDATVFTIPAYGETEEETFSVAAFGATVTLGYELSGYEVTYYVDETPIEGSTFTMPNEYVEAVVVDAMVSGTTQTIVLATGTNWVSVNVEVTLDELKAALVAALPETAITIKGKAGSIKYVVRTHNWNGTLVWDITNMYKIEVPSACELTLGGMPINPAEHPITITPNTANWIAYPLSNSMTLSEAFAGFEAVTGDVIQSKGGSARYRNGSWRSNGLTTLDPGQGYIYKSAATGDRTLVFPSSK